MSLLAASLSHRAVGPFFLLLGFFAFSPLSESLCQVGCSSGYVLFVMPGTRSYFNAIRQGDQLTARQALRLRRDLRYRTSHSGPDRRFVECPSIIAADLKKMAKGKALHVALDGANGCDRASGKAAAHAAWKAGFLDRPSYSRARLTLIEADTAKHVSNLTVRSGRPAWADFSDLGSYPPLPAALAVHSDDLDDPILMLVDAPACDKDISTYPLLASDPLPADDGDKDKKDDDDKNKKDVDDKRFKVVSDKGKKDDDDKDKKDVDDKYNKDGVLAPAAFSERDARLDLLQHDLAQLRDSLPILRDSVLRMTADLIKSTVPAMIKNVVPSITEGILAPLAASSEALAQRLTDALENVHNKLSHLDEKYVSLSAPVPNPDLAVPRPSQNSYFSGDSEGDDADWFLYSQPALARTTALKSARHNDAPGFVQGFDKASNRWIVRLWGQDNAMKFKRCNLVPYRPMGADVCQACAQNFNLFAIPHCLCWPADECAGNSDFALNSSCGPAAAGAKAPASATAPDSARGSRSDCHRVPHVYRELPSPP